MADESQVYLNITTTPDDTEGPVVPPLSGYQDDQSFTMQSNNGQNNSSNTIQAGQATEAVVNPVRPTPPITYPTNPAASEAATRPEYTENLPHAHISISDRDPLEEDDDALKNEERSPMPASYPEVHDEEITPAPIAQTHADNDEGLAQQDYPTFVPGTEDTSVTDISDVPTENIENEVAIEMSDQLFEAAVEEEKTKAVEVEERAKEIMQSIDLDKDPVQDAQTEATLNENSIPAGASMHSVLELIDKMEQTTHELEDKLDVLKNTIQEAKQKVA